jgi:hypothetical protein
MSVWESFAVGFIILVVLYSIFGPYYSLFKLGDIAKELEEIRKILEKKEGEG